MTWPARRHKERSRQPSTLGAAIALAAALLVTSQAFLMPIKRAVPQGQQSLPLCRRSSSEGSQGPPDGLAELKAALIESCDVFRAKQEEMWAVMEKEEGSKKSKKAAASSSSSSSLLEAESFAAQRVALSSELAALRNKTVGILEELSALNPTKEPNLGWRGFGGQPPSSCILNGTWKLIFTDAADATFKKGKRGEAFAFQEIDSDAGWFVNCVDFSSQDSKLKGFRVFVEGEALSANEMQLSFRKVRLLRRSRIPWLFGTITIPLPNPKLLRNIGRWFARRKGGQVNPSDRGAGFRILYLDKELRAHQTFDGLYFIQKRLA